jgi:transposase-like protein
MREAASTSIARQWPAGSIAPKAVADGVLGFWKALAEVWPKTREQRCWVHKTANPRPSGNL